MVLSIFTIYLVITSASFASEQTELEKQLETLRDAYVISGISAAIYRDGQLVEHAVSGIRKVGSPELIFRDDKFHLGSCTKSMTATVAATFVEEGKLSWKSKLSDLLPEIEIHPDLKTLSYEMLLAHGSGLDKDPDDETYIELKKLETWEGREKLIALYLGKAPTFKVGTFNYRNIAYIIAGHILEKISGKSWEMLLQERLFIPLGMQSCGFGPTSEPNETVPTQPWGHVIKDWTIMPVHEDNAFAESFFSTMKTEMEYNHFANLEDARKNIFEYINWYNCDRIHSSLGYLSPMEYLTINNQSAA